MLISFIVPLYNCGSYIVRCLDSIFKQGLETKDFEVIVVNDGSTDNGPELVADYISTRPNITLINQKNSGVSAARNKGLAEARGEWIHFVDADDYLIDGGIKFILDNDYTKDCEIVKFSSKTINSSQNINDYNNHRTSKMLFSGGATICQQIRLQRGCDYISLQ